MDRSSIIGLILGVAAVAAGSVLEGGKIASILQPTAAVIVFGGTAGAVLVSFPLRDVLKAVAALGTVFFPGARDSDSVIRTVVHYASVARKNGLVALEPEIRRIQDPFLARSLSLAVDGMHPKALRETMEQEIRTFEEERARTARVFETAGGFAPTIGIIGAVLGLIHVMENLSDPSKLGAGIAVAFVATVYGVGSANLLLLPIAKKLMVRMRAEVAVREMIIEGVIGIMAGLNPYYLEAQMRAYLEDRPAAR